MSTLEQVAQQYVDELKARIVADDGAKPRSPTMSALDWKCRNGLEADPEVAWLVILEILKHELTDGEMCYFAAGPLEILLSNHGDTFIERVEERAASDGKFLLLLCRVWRLSMSEEVWRRVQVAQARNH